MPINRISRNIWKIKNQEMADYELRSIHISCLYYLFTEDSEHIWKPGLDEVRYTSIGSVIGTHAGPGAVVVAFFTK